MTEKDHNSDSSNEEQNAVQAGDLPTDRAEVVTSETYAETPEFVTQQLEQRYPVGAIVHHFETLALHVVIWHLPREIVDDLETEDGVPFREAHDVPAWAPGIETVRVVDAAAAGLPVTETSVSELREADSLETTVYPFPRAAVPNGGGRPSSPLPGGRPMSTKTCARCGATVAVSEFVDAMVTDDSGGGAISLCADCFDLLTRARCVGCGAPKTGSEKADRLCVKWKDHGELPVCDDCRDRWLYETEAEGNERTEVSHA